VFATCCVLHPPSTNSASIAEGFGQDIDSRDRHALDEIEPVAVEPRNPARVIREQA
jgi:hypothetical protein